MNDERLHRLLGVADQPLAPDPAFGAALRDQIRQELGFIVATPDDPLTIRRGLARPHRRRGPTHLLLVAAIVSAGAIGLAAVAGSLVNRTHNLRSDLYQQIEQAASIRIAIRPDHPQFSVPGQPAAGFDGDVATALASHMGLRAATVLDDSAAMLAEQADGQWDIALPSVADWTLDRSRLLVSTPYYWWPHRLVVAETSSAQGPADLAGDPVCAVASDQGEAWLRGAYAGAVGPPITTQVVTRASDDECLAALATGEVAALVTARLSDADLQVRSGIRVIGGPGPEARPLIIPRDPDGGPDPTDVLAAVDSALDQMRDDGSLSRLSQSRFGGADLSAP
jgi:ABC-type amino acid transport substrate-binding protein